MTIYYVGRIEGVQNGNAWIKPLASGYLDQCGWKKEVLEKDFPDRGNAYFSKNYNDEVHNDTIWIFDIEENLRYEPDERGTKYIAINSRPAYFFLDLTDFNDPFELRSALRLGISTARVPAAKHAHWLIRTGDGKAVYFAPDRLNFDVRIDGLLTMTFNPSLLEESFDVEVYDLSDMPLNTVKSEFFDPAWLPKKKEIHCWESDVQFMSRIVNRVRKLKPKFNKAGMTITEPFEITKARANEALELLTWASSLTDATEVDKGMLERLSCVFEKLDTDQVLLNEVFSLVYDNETLDHYLQIKEEDHIKRRRGELENELSIEHQKLEEASEKLNTFINDRNLLLKEIEEAKNRLKECQKIADQELFERKGKIEQEFLLFQGQLQLQANAASEQLTLKLAESITQSQLLQVISGSSLLPHAIQNADFLNTTEECLVLFEAEDGIKNVGDWKALLNKCSKVYCIDEDVLLFADVVCRSREIPLLCGKLSAWVAQCYASLFGTQRVLRYTPGPTTLGLDDLFYRGGAAAATQLQLFIEKALQHPSLVHLVILEQIYCEQAHFWLPSLSREMRLGSRIPENLVMIICASADVEKLEEIAKEATWKIECQEVAISSSGLVFEPKSQSDKSQGLDTCLLNSGNLFALSVDSEFNAFQNKLRNSHGKNPEYWSRFSRLMTTAKDLDEHCMSKFGEHLIQDA